LAVCSIDVNPMPQTGQQGYSQAANRAPASRMGGPLMTGAGGGVPQSRMMTANRAGGEARPMTSVSGAGFQSKPATQRSFDPLNAASRGPAPPLAQKQDNSPEDMAKEMERQVNALIEESAQNAVQRDLAVALEKAKEAGKKERQLCKHREQHGLVDQINLDLTYSVCFNLANAYHLNGMFDEALHTYSLIVKNKQYPQSGRLRVNMGNIYYEQKKYTNAIKMYRMALDQIPNTGKEIRFKIMRNIGNSFVRLGQFQDAIQSYEAIMEGNADFQSGFNLIICYFALGDSDKMRRGFTKLLGIPIQGMGEDEEEEDAKAAEAAEAVGEKKLDGLRVELRERQRLANEFITTAAKMCAPVLDRRDWVAGYEWMIEALKAEHESVASELEICKALHYLRERQFSKAIEVLKSFEKKDQTLKAMAATNLSFLYFLENNLAEADKYANLAVRHDRYNAKALVNKGNCLYVKGELERAKELFLEAIGVEADCVESIYNLGLVNKKLGVLTESQQAFEKLHSIIPNNPEVIYQIANLHDMQGNYRHATKWFNILITRVPTDPGVLSRLGQIFNKDDDETQAFHFHLESYRYYPVNLDVISWLGVWYVKSELYEKAIQFFERASQIQPQEVKWKLMVTSCYRRMGNYQKALEYYEEIHAQYPENLECLRYLVAICKDLGHHYDHYQKKLAKLERANAARTQNVNQGGALTRIGGGGGYEDQGPPPQQQQMRQPPQQQQHQQQTSQRQEQRQPEEQPQQQVPRHMAPPSQSSVSPTKNQIASAQGKNP
jgi:intraflagellar transport protein 88